MANDNAKGALPDFSAPPEWKGRRNVPDGPVLQDSTLDEEIASLSELARIYPLPPGYGYVLTEWGQPVVEHRATGSRFSILLEEEILVFEWKQTIDGREVYHTVEISRGSSDVSFPDAWPLPGASELDQAPAPQPASADWLFQGEREERQQNKRRKELLDRVRRQLRNGNVWTHRDDRCNYEGLVRAFQDGEEPAAELAEAVSTLLADENRLVRSGAVATLPYTGELIGEERLLDVLEERRELFHGVNALGSKGANYFQDLYSRVLCALSDVASPGNQRAVRVLRAAAEEGLQAALSGLARIDADWFCEHAARVVPRENVLGMLHALTTPVHRERFVRALAPWPAREREDALDRRAWEHLPIGPEEKARLRAIIRGDTAAGGGHLSGPGGLPGPSRIKLNQRAERFSVAGMVVGIAAMLFAIYPAVYALSSELTRTGAWITAGVAFGAGLVVTLVSLWFKRHPSAYLLIDRAQRRLTLHIPGREDRSCGFDELGSLEIVDYVTIRHTPYGGIKPGGKSSRYGIRAPGLEGAYLFDTYWPEKARKRKALIEKLVG